MPDSTWLIVSLVVMVIGLAGTFLPVIPGIPLIFLAILGYGIVEGFHIITLGFLIVMFLVALVASLLDYAGGAIGAKRFGATRNGVIGAIAGGIVGILILGPIGLLAGPFIGAVIGEMWRGRPFEIALEAGLGTMLGIAGATLVKVIIAIGMILAFIWRVW